jgi:hypothetical protein
MRISCRPPLKKMRSVCRSKNKDGRGADDCQSHGGTGREPYIKAAFTRYKLARVSQVPGMSAQTFHASYEKFDRLSFEVSWTSIIVLAWNVCARIPGTDSRERTCVL